MAKVAKPKTRAVSVRSRAARREASPSLDLDKSLKNVKPPTSTSTYPLQSKDAGIRKRKQKPMRRAQRLRQLRGMERAAVVQDQLEKKVEASMDKLKSAKDRRKRWDDLNNKLGSSGRFAALADEFDEEADKQRQWRDVPDAMNDVQADDAEVQKDHTPIPASPFASGAPVNDEDEIL